MICLIVWLKFLVQLITEISTRSLNFLKRKKWIKLADKSPRVGKPLRIASRVIWRPTPTMIKRSDRLKTGPFKEADSVVAQPSAQGREPSRSATPSTDLNAIQQPSVSYSCPISNFRGYRRYGAQLTDIYFACNESGHLRMEFPKTNHAYQQSK